MATKIVFLSLQNDPVNGNNLELGFSDGTPGGATILDLYPGLDGANFFNSSHPHYFTQLGDKILFQATTQAEGRELWITDGTAIGTSLVLNIRPGSASAFLDNGNFNVDNDSFSPLVIGNTMYFTADDGTHGFELWKTDGTPGNTTQVKDINSIGGTASFPTSFVDFNGTLYFVANDGVNGAQIWKSDGTDATTTRVTNLAHPAGSGISSLVASGNFLYFIYNDGNLDPTHAQQVYVTDGTFGTEHLLAPSHPATLDPRNFADINGTLYFTMNDGQNGYEMWKSNGTEATTVLVKDIFDDGTHGSSAPSGVPFAYFEFNGEVYFGATDAAHNFELWKTNGTAAGTTLVKDINAEPNGPGTHPGFTSGQFAVFNGELYFAASDGIQAGKHNIELWKTNGTGAGTVLVADLFAGTGPGTPVEFEVIDGVLYFGANAVGGGFGQLWRYDGVNPPVIISSNYHFGGGHEPFSFIAGPVNTPPTQNANTGAVVVEGQSGAIGNAQLDYNDAEQADAQITYTVTTLPTGGTLLRNGVALGLGGTFTQDDIVNNLLSYTHGGGENPADSFGFSVSDGVAPALTGKTFAFTISPVNDAPVNAVPGAQVVNEDTNLAIAGLAISDADAAAGSVTTKLSVLHGTLTVAPAGGAAVAGSGTGAVTLTGTVAQINTTLSAAGNIVYKGLQDYNGGDTLTVLTDDGGNSGSGGAKTDSDNVAITVNAVADPPTITSDGGGAAANLNRPENATAVTTVTATDPDSASITFSIVGGSDAAKFEIDTSNGVLKFINAPNFEAPSDSDANNSYVVQVSASDGALTDEQTITVNVTDVVPELAKKNDFNADGKADILFQATDGTPKVWLVDGVNVSLMGPPLLNPNGVEPRAGGPYPWRAMDSGDFNGDGRSDILWQHADGTPAVWLMNGVNLLSTGPALLNPGPSWHVIAAGDFNGDLMSDILWQNQDGTPAVWLMNGTGVLSTGPALLNPGPTWHAKDAADFNGDGKADILWQNDNGTPAVWLMNGTNVLSTGPALLNPGPTWHVEKAGDFNGDGKADILWQNANGTPAVWLMDGTNVLATGPALANPGPAWHVKEAADANGDGKADIFWQNDDGTPGIWLMNGTSVLQTGGALANQGPAWHIV